MESDPMESGPIYMSSDENFVADIDVRYANTLPCLLQTDKVLPTVPTFRPTLRSIRTATVRWRCERAPGGY